MDHISDNVRSLAEAVIVLIDAGRVSAARELLAQVARQAASGSHTELHGKPDLSRQLAADAVACIVGSAKQANFLARPEILGGGNNIVVIVDVSNSMSFASSGFANKDLLAEMRTSLLSDPRQLQVAQDCMRHIGSVTRTSAAQGWWDMWERPSSALDEAHTDILKHLLRAQRAQQAVSERAKLRLLWAAREAGLPQREIASLVEEPQTQVFRKLKSIDEDPGLLSLTPRELSDRFKAGHIDRQTLLKMLAAYPYTSGEFPVDEPYWGYVPGSWDELAQLAIEEEISDEELELIVDASRSLADLNG